MKPRRRWKKTARVKTDVLTLQIVEALRGVDSYLRRELVARAAALNGDWEIVWRLKDRT